MKLNFGVCYTSILTSNFYVLYLQGVDRIFIFYKIILKSFVTLVPDKISDRLLFPCNTFVLE